MKLLVLLLALLFGVWLWRRRHRATPRPHRPPQLKAEAMVACDHCGLHVPRSTAVIGRKGCYCSEAHRKQAEHG